MAHQVAERLTVQGIRQTRGYKSNLLKKQRQEAAKAAAEAAAKAAAAIATTASPKGKVFEIIFQKSLLDDSLRSFVFMILFRKILKGKNSKKDPPSIMRANEEGKLWISKEQRKF